MTINRESIRVMVCFALACVGAVLLNAFTQPGEEELQLIKRATSFWKDWLWYMDDIIGPGFFMGGAACFYFAQVLPRKKPVAMWPLALLAAAYFAFGLVDTLDAHWVPAANIEGQEGLTNITSNLSKLGFSIVLVFTAIYSSPWLTGRARRAVYLVAFLMILDLITLGIWLDFAGLAFHIFEECMEVVAGMLIAFMVSMQPVREQPLPE